MSLIPFILDLADELHELGRCLANGVDVDDFGFGIYPNSGGCDQVQSGSQCQQNVRRARSTPFYWLQSKRHHPYGRKKSVCCNKLHTEENAHNSENQVDRDINDGSTGVNILNSSSSSTNASSTSVTPGKPAAYSVVNRNGFQVSMNVKQFAPNELSVKTINNCIVVEGRHDDKEDGHGVISRHFVRKYMLPKGYDPNDVTSTLSSDGILTVRAPPPMISKNSERQERVIEIQQFSGPTQVLSTTKEKNKDPAKSVMSVNQSMEKKLKLQQSMESKIDENPLKELITGDRNVITGQPICQELQQQNAFIAIPQKVVSNEQQLHHPKQNDKILGQVNIEGTAQTGVVVVSLNVENLQENGEAQCTDTLMSVDSQNETESSTTVPLIPETEKHNNKNCSTQAKLTNVQSTDEDQKKQLNPDSEITAKNIINVDKKVHDSNASITTTTADPAAITIDNNNCVSSRKESPISSITGSSIANNNQDSNIILESMMVDSNNDKNEMETNAIGQLEDDPAISKVELATLKSTTMVSRPSDDGDASKSLTKMTDDCDGIFLKTQLRKTPATMENKETAN